MSRALKRVVAGVAIVACSSLVSIGARADLPPPNPGAAAPTKEQIEEARIRYNRGQELYTAGDYKIALIEFERAYQIAPTFQVLFNVGQVNLQLNNYAAAARAFERYLSEGGSRVPPERRTQVEAELKSLASRTAHLTVRTDPSSADVTIDDQPVGSSPVEKLLVDSGQHRIQVAMRGYEPATKLITVATGDDAAEDIKLTPKEQIKIAAPAKSSYTWIG